MYRLIIDSSTKVMFIGLTKDFKLILSRVRVATRDHAKYIVNEIDLLLSEADLSIDQIAEIIVGSGPGSYTGLRVACMTAKMLAWTKKITLKEVSSLFFLTSGYTEKVTGLMDARNNNFFLATYDNLETIIPEQLATLDDFYLNHDFLESRKVLISPDSYQINAEKIIKKATIVNDIHAFVPNYLRKAKAEMKHD